jgi:hypothetical protein
MALIVNVTGVPAATTGDLEFIMRRVMGIIDAAPRTVTERAVVAAALSGAAAPLAHTAA